MLKAIIKTISIYKMFKFNKQGNVELNINKSSIIFTSQGDIKIKADRHIIYTRELSFDGCSLEFVEQTIANYQKKVEPSKPRHQHGDWVCAPLHEGLLTQ